LRVERLEGESTSFLTLESFVGETFRTLFIEETILSESRLSSIRQRYRWKGSNEEKGKRERGKRERGDPDGERGRE